VSRGGTSACDRVFFHRYGTDACYVRGMERRRTATDGDGGLFCTPSLPSEDASQPASVRFLRGYVPSS
jgi:hypothetical protein